ncbi:hypothetical protein HN51_044495 [Arachis hypogaea]
MGESKVRNWVAEERQSEVGKVECLPIYCVLAPIPTSIFVSHESSQELEHVELHDEEEDDKPIFFLTDEWREFFAKAEARKKHG